MANISIVNISTPNDGLGDPLRVSQDKANINFAELNVKKVEAVPGKDLSENNFTDAYKAKLDSIDLDAQINVQSDWLQEDNTKDNFIKNKPSYLNAVGSFHYADEATQTTPISIVANVDKKITNDSLGIYTDTTNAPYGVPTVWDAVNNQFDFSSLAVGDLVNIRLDLILDTTGADQIFKFYVKLGIGSPSEFTLPLSQGQVKTTSAFRITEALPFDIGSEDIRDYPAEVWLLTDKTATVVVNGWYVEILRKNINIVDFTDINAVHKTGDEVISGTKTFKEPLDASGVVTINGDEIKIANISPVESVRLTPISIIKQKAGIDYTYSLPDKSGTVAMTSDIPAPLGFTPENVANKSDSYTASSTTTYPNTKALVDGLATKQNTLTNPITGTGTTNKIPKFTGSGSIGNSLMTDNGLQVGFGNVEGLAMSANSYIGQLSGHAGLVFGVNHLNVGIGVDEAMRITSNRNLLVNTKTDNGVNKLQVNGSILGTALKLSTTPTTSAETFDVLTRNTTTGVIEKVASSLLTTPTLQQVTTAGNTTSNKIVSNYEGADPAIYVTNLGGNGILSITTEEAAIVGTSNSGVGGGFSSEVGNGANISSFSGIGAEIYSDSGIGAKIYSGNGTGINISSFAGVPAVVDVGSVNINNIAEFKKDGTNQAFITHDGEVTANGFKTPTGTSSQFLKADGSVDSDTYVLYDDLVGKYVTEASQTGIVFFNNPRANYGNIGVDAVDFSYADVASSIFGATGESSFNTGINTTSSGYNSATFGFDNTTSAIGGFTTGFNSQNAGYTNYVAGIGHDVTGMNMTVVGQASNVIAESTASFNVATAPVFVVGNGTITDADPDYTVASRSDALIVRKNGVIEAPSQSIAEIDAGVAKTVPTKEWVEAARVVKLKQYTVATLPTGTQGDTAYVTDATAPTYLGTLTGGGAVVCPVFYNGTAWVSH